MSVNAAITTLITLVTIIYFCAAAAMADAAAAAADAAAAVAVAAVATAAAVVARLQKQYCTTEKDHDCFLHSCGIFNFEH